MINVTFTQYIIIIQYSYNWIVNSKKLGVHLLVVTIWNSACLIAPVVTTTSGILSSNKIQNGDVMVTANPDASG